MARHGLPTIPGSDGMLRDEEHALSEAARTMGASYRLGVSQSKDSFYGEVEPDRMPMPQRLHDRWDAFVAGGAICSEMEAAAIFVLGSIHRVRTGGLMHMWSEGDGAEEDRRTLLRTSVEALRVLIRQDAAGSQWP